MKSMNTIAVVAISALTFWGCGTSEVKTDAPVAETPAVEERHQDSETDDGPGLNHGVKWKADENTNGNVQKLRAIIDKFDTSGDKSLDGYLNTGAELQLGVEELIKGCRMQGPEHDALHKWLEPLMERIRDLSASTSLDQAERVYRSASEQIRLYSEYFE